MKSFSYLLLLSSGLTVTGLFLFCSVLGARTPPDGELVYRTNCTRCHRAMPSFTPRVTATVLMHMRVKAMLTDQEKNAVLGYLLESAGPANENTSNPQVHTKEPKQ